MGMVMVCGLCILFFNFKQLFGKFNQKSNQNTFVCKITNHSPFLNLQIESGKCE